MAEIFTKDIIDPTVAGNLKTTGTTVEQTDGTKKRALDMHLLSSNISETGRDTSILNTEKTLRELLNLQIEHQSKILEHLRIITGADI